jgi:hypothetical protein
MIREQLIGSWRLTAADWRGADGRIRDLHGSPAGRLTYDTDGYMTAQTLSSDRQPYASANPMEATAEELAQGCASLVSYYGTYEVDEAARIVRHSVEMAALPNWIGSIQERHVEFDGDVLALSAPLPTDGKDGTVILRWMRLK